MFQKFEGIKTTLWTGLAVSLLFVVACYSQSYWLSKINLIEQIVLGLFAVGIIFTAQFSRSRYTLLIISLLSFYLLFQQQLVSGDWFIQHQKWIFLSAMFILSFLVNVKDRSLISVHGALRFAAIFSCILLAKGWLILGEYLTAQTLLLGWPAQLSANITITLPLLLSCSYILFQSLRYPSLLIASLLTSLLVASLAYYQQLTLPLSAMLTLLLVHYIVVVVIDSYYLAYRDELTTIPSRRALNQYALSLGRRYCVAMVDIDHFKKFNDSYGHDIGDQVLKLVAAKLATVAEGGKAFRYGGEEFTLIFPRKTIEGATPELERIRQLIADYKIIIRHPVRKNKKARGSKPTEQTKTVSVTVSMGVSAREDKQSFEQVVKVADQALYRAKKKGRNNVSR
ncbi:GGDEF domain-containing protein [Thalassotalea sp. 1_MG-2023]|uniref:GGDEF domain-containing protein n=1 Tax=Thalassotalea sp. 1_MG-2023 TaxID=3062680 RepID=UPI0026E1F714|nr:GGDEF domain-containing protein [Thalassotalea sp. 1_MG-2023]MDO6428022.1 GGDEF domain-containing protein [Thalassotalea sp. 1_MG-2023]